MGHHKLLKHKRKFSLYWRSRRENRENLSLFFYRFQCMHFDWCTGYNFDNFPNSIGRLMCNIDEIGWHYPLCIASWMRLILSVLEISGCTNDKTKRSGVITSTTCSITRNIWITASRSEPKATVPKWYRIKFRKLVPIGESSSFLFL